MSVVRPKNWCEFQHYKDRAPVWIKLHRRLLDDLEFNQLDAFACKVLVLFWLLASENEDGAVVYDATKIAFRMRLATVEVADALETLITIGLIVGDGVAAVGEDRRASAKKLREVQGFGSRHISDAVKREVWSRDGGRCVQCAAAEDIEYDHIIPVSKNGSSEATNVQLLCRPCNRKKRTATPAERVATHAQQPPKPAESREQVTSNKGEAEKKRPRACADADLPEWVPLQAWNDFAEMRRKIRAPMTNKAIQLAIGDLEKLRDAGHDLCAVLEQSTMRSWRGLFAPSETTNGRTQQQGRGIRDAAEHALAAIRRDAEEGEGNHPRPQQRQALTSQKSTGETHSGNHGTNSPSNGSAGRSFPEPKSFNGGAEPAISGVLRRSGTPIGTAIAGSLQALSNEPREQIFPDARTIVGIGKVIQ